MMRSKITRILSYKHQKHQKNYSTFRQFSNYTHYSALFRGAKLRNSGTPKGQVTVLIYDNTLLLFRIRTCPLSPSSGVLPLTLLNLGCTRHSSSELGSALICTRFQAAFVVCYLYRGRCPDAMLPLWSYKSELLTPKPKAYHHLPYRRSPSSPRR